MLVYSTSTSDARRGWDAFDQLVLWAVTVRPGSVDTIAAAVPAGIEFRLIEQALHLAVADGSVTRRRVSRVSGDTVPRIVTTVVYEPTTAHTTTRKAA